MKPVILIAPDDGFNPMFQAPHTIISSNYTKCVLEAGGIPVVAFDVNCAAEYAAMADGLLLTGGMSDILERKPAEDLKLIPEGMQQF